MQKLTTNMIISIIQKASLICWNATKLEELSFYYFIFIYINMTLVLKMAAIMVDQLNH